ncbi:MAG TPA: universal stress protein [Legionella sp.]|nr:universal stress protein [Legionella sp.]
MQKFHKILFVSHGVQDETKALEHALQLTDDHEAQLSILVVCPSFPDELSEYRASYEDSLIDKINKAIKMAKSSLKLKNKKIPINIEVDCGSTPDIRIIRHVLKYSHDLLIKGAETSESTKGFKALDMALLRKCPCALFLYRPFHHASDAIQIAVAIDPNDEELAGQELALRLLNISSLLAENYAGRLKIISCWSFALENYLRDNVWINTSKEELEKLISEEKQAHKMSMESLVKRSNINNDYTIEQLKGKPEDLIPAAITDKKIDILIMGTVARTGISGFIIGNTAENILQKIDCSLLALKPQGFVSPVKAH